MGRRENEPLVPDHSLRGRIYTRIRDDILDGRFQIGEGLVELKLAEEFGVSRTPIREALLQLEQEGLVRYETHRGSVVLGISDQDVMDIYAIRRLIEGLAAYLAAQRATPEDRKALTETVDLMEFYTERDDVDRVTELDARFHSQILEAAQSRPLSRALGGFMHYIQRARTKSLRTPGRPRKSLGEHRGIVNAIVKGKPKRAQALMNQHVGNVNLLQFEQAPAGEKEVPEAVDPK